MLPSSPRGVSLTTLIGNSNRLKRIPHSAAALISMIYFCCGGITVLLPMEGEDEPEKYQRLRGKPRYSTTCSFRPKHDRITPGGRGGCSRKTVSVLPLATQPSSAIHIGMP
jgi:hypothetical protein